MNSVLTISELTVGQVIPERAHRPDNVQLMLYNAVLWNGHRIHFDEPYTTEVEGYPGLVIAGPLLGDWLHQALEEWLGEGGELLSIEYSNRLATYIGETLIAGGIVQSIDVATREATLEVYVKNEAGDVAAPGTAQVRLTT
jgi:hydroxyacyl-ACP dehydratase HTD2-like protein with hotdog domain